MTETLPAPQHDLDSPIIYERRLDVDDWQIVLVTGYSRRTTGIARSIAKYAYTRCGISGRDVWEGMGNMQAWVARENVHQVRGRVLVSHLPDGRVQVERPGATRVVDAGRVRVVARDQVVLANRRPA